MLVGIPCLYVVEICMILYENGFVGMSVKEIIMNCTKHYVMKRAEEMDCISVLNKMIDTREGREGIM